MFRETLELLNHCRVPYVVSGAFALQVHTGIWRCTKDLDLFLAPEDMRAAMDCLKQSGFQCESTDPVWLHKVRRNGFFVDLITGMSNAVITVDRSWIERANPAIIFGVRARVLGAEELLASKLFVVRRERFDGADIAHIIYRTKGKIDWERILELADGHWEVVLIVLMLFRYVYPAHTDYVPAPLWQDLLSRYMHAVQHPDLSAPFRGSLVDENIFSIDVKDWGLEDLQSEYRARQLQKTPGSSPSVGVIRRSGT